MGIGKRFLNGRVILVTSIGSVAGKCVISKLRECGCLVIGVDIYPYSWVVNASEVNFFYQVDLTLNKDKYRQQIIDICDRHNIELIVPLTDIDVDFFDENRLLFENKGIVLCIQNRSTLQIVRDKKKAEEYIAKISTGIQAIPTKEISEKADAYWEFPFVCKIKNGRSSQGLKIIETDEEYKAFVCSSGATDYVIEPFIKGDICVADLVYQKALGQFVVVLRKELIRTNHGCGTTVEIFSDGILESECKKLASGLEINGCVNFEFIKDEAGKYWFLECNPRFSAGVAFSNIAGYDFVSNHMRCFLNLDIDLKINLHEQIIARRYEEYCI